MRYKFCNYWQIVAVKKLNHSGLQGEKEFLVEVLMLSLLRHSNLVNLIGYCAEGEQRLLVYEFMPLGSLEDQLYGNSSRATCLMWNEVFFCSITIYIFTPDWSRLKKLLLYAF